MYVQRVDSWALSGSVVFLVNSEIFTYEYERPYINYLLFFLLRGLSPRANYTDRAAAASRRS